MEKLYLLPRHEQRKFREEHKTEDIKIMTKEEFVAQLDFSYSLDANIFIMRKWPASYSFSQEIISAMQLLFCSIDTNDKISRLFALKQEMLSLNLLNHNEYFFHFITNIKIVISSYYAEDEELKFILSDKDVEFLNKKIDDSPLLNINSFNDAAQETIDCFNKISRLLEENKNYHLAIFCEPNYKHYINHINSFYHFPINKLSRSSLYYSPLAQQYLSSISTGIPLDLKTIYASNDEVALIENKVKSLEEFTLTPEEKVDILSQMFKTITLDVVYENAINFEENIDNLTYYDYVFVLGLNENIFSPNKDNRFLTDDELILCHKNSSSIRNILNEKRFLSAIYSPACKLSIARNSYFSKTEHELLYLIADKKIMIHEAYEQHRYSKEADEEYLSKLKDEKRVFLTRTPFLTYLSKFYNDHDYQSYTNKNYGDLTALDLSTHYSYSSLDEYQLCPYRYYLSHILKLRDDCNFNITYGNIIHKYLELANTGMSITSSQLLQDYQLSDKEKLLLNKILRLLDEKVHFFTELKEVIHANSSFCEEKFEIALNVPLVGKIDYIIASNNYYLIIDFKTYTPSVSLSALELGINMQLPIYYLLSHDKFVGKELLGLYYSAISSKEDSPKLSGLTIADHLEGFCDAELPNFLLHGSGKSKLFISKDKFFELVEATKKEIFSIETAIQKFEFPISPLKSDSLNLDGCKFCSFRDICNVVYRDFRYQEIEKDEGALTHEMDR